MKSVFFFFVTTISFISISFGQENPSIAPFNLKSLQDTYLLDTDVKFIPHDDLHYKDGFPSTVKTYSVKLSGNFWQLQVKEAANYNGVGWFELPFTMPQNDKIEKVGLWLPVCYGGLQVYLNGELVYESRSFNGDEADRKSGTKSVVVELPSQILVQGENRLDFRLASVSGWGGSSTPFFHIGSWKKLETEWVQFLVVNIAISFICLFLFIYFIIHFLFRKKEIYNLFFSLFCFFTGIFIIGFNGLGYYIYDSPVTYWMFAFIGGINMYLFPILFVHSFYSLRLKVFAKIFIGFYIFLNVFVLVEYGITQQLYYFNNYIYMFFNLSYIFLAVYLVGVSIQNVLKKMPYATSMLIGVIFLFATFVQSMLVFAVVLRMLPLIGEGFFFMAVAFAVVLARRFAQTHTNLELSHNDLRNAHANIQELNRTLEEKVAARTAELKEKNQEITESIEYASLIQRSILPNDGRLRAAFSDHFILWNPRDIVGGDLYWFSPRGRDFFLALLDCTGHGVPGALLTMTASSILDNVTTKTAVSTPEAVLEELHTTLVRQLNQENEEEALDFGLDIALCYYDDKKRRLRFSGSRLSLFAFEDGRLTEIKGDRREIGYSRSRPAQPFTCHEVPVHPDTRYYLTSDGLFDQNGGEKGFGFGKKRFIEFLETNGHLSLGDQRKAFEAVMTQWRDGARQRDDISFIGFQIKF